MRRAEADRRLEIIAHAHAEIGKSAFARDALQQREMKRGLFLSRRDAHQPQHGKIQHIAAMPDEGNGLFGRDAGLLRFLTGVHFDKKFRPPSGFLNFRFERFGEFQPVERMDAVEQPKRLAHLVGLKRPDEMQLRVRKARAQFGPFGASLLDAVFAEDTVTGLEHRQNALRSMAFAHGDESRFLSRRDCCLPRAPDTGENSLEIQERIDGYGGVFGGQIMASALARAKLARAARALNARFPALPPLILMTDQLRLRDPIAVARVLPKGAAIILRHTDADARASLAECLIRIARERALLMLVAGDAALAARLGCDGLHLPEARAPEAAHWKALHPSWLITAAAHSARGVGTAARSRCDAVLLAPAFPTRSHIERAAFGVSRFRFVAERAALPIYALGGVNAQTVRRFAGARLAGIAAIEALIAGQSS